MRLIDADALMDAMREEEFQTFVPFDEVDSVIDKTPTIEAVPVVRCGECERRAKSADLSDSIYCPYLKLQMRKIDFCSFGKRSGDYG